MTIHCISSLTCNVITTYTTNAQGRHALRIDLHVNRYNAEPFRYKPWIPKGFFSILNHHKCLLYLNTYVDGSTAIMHILIISARGPSLDVRI